MVPRIPVPTLRKMNHIIAAATILLVLALTACATLTKKQCLQGDWHAIGFNDGLNGRTHGYFDWHVKACNRVEVVPDKTIWLAGHKKGARQYCQPDNAYKEGLRGKAYHNICEPDQHRVFSALHGLGKSEYWLIELRDFYANEIARYERELDEKEAFWDKTGVDDHQSYGERKRLRREIRLSRQMYLKQSDELADFRRRLQMYGMWQMAGLSNDDKPD